MSVDLTCEKIINSICTSKLDYHMNQTPYSIHFSIRKKFIKGYKHQNHSEYSENFYTESSEVQLFNLKKEYAKLFSFYETALANEKFLESEMLRLSNNYAELDQMKQKIE